MTHHWATHTIKFEADRVIKRFRSSSRGEHEREWRALILLAEFAPGLAPTPLSLDLATETPVVVMSRLKGVPLRGQAVAPLQIKALAAAVTTMHSAIHPRVLSNLPIRPNRGAVSSQILELHQQRTDLDRPPIVARAVHDGLAWLSRSDVDGDADTPAVFGLRDGNLANYLWDGSRVQVVDFEDSGPSDRAFELAEIMEHASSWVDTEFDASLFLQQFDLTPREVQLVQQCRRLLALFWLFLLEGSSHPANPPDAAERQAGRLLELLSRQSY